MSAFAPTPTTPTAPHVDVRDLARLRTDARLCQLAVAGLLGEVAAAQRDAGDPAPAVLDPLTQAESLLHDAQVALTTAIDVLPKMTVRSDA